MLILSVPWDFRSLWAALTVTAKLYIICLLAASAYTTYSLTRITVRLRKTAKLEQAHMLIVHEMAAKAKTLRESHTMLFLLFGLCWSNDLFATLRGIQHSVDSLSATSFGVFGPVVAFAFVVFAVLLFLHGFRWAVAHRLQPVPTPTITKARLGT
jgi:CDP-diglyceride synthetase